MSSPRSASSVSPSSFSSPQFHKLMEDEHLKDPSSNWDKEVLKGTVTRAVATQDLNDRPLIFLLFLNHDRHGDFISHEHNIEDRIADASWVWQCRH